MGTGCEERQACAIPRFLPVEERGNCFGLSYGRVFSVKWGFDEQVYAGGRCAHTAASSGGAKFSSAA